MICTLRGVVTGLVKDGFTVQPDGDGPQDKVSTQLPGRTLRLSAGDRVLVLGGPDPKTGDFASSGVFRLLPNGDEVSVRVNWSDPPDKSEGKAWWKFW